MNNLDPEVAENPDALVVYGGTGRAARSWECFDAIVASLRALRDDETLLVQSGKPVGIARTHEMAPRVLIANSLLVPRWATWEEFWRLEAMGLTMYGQMTAGSWIYIGTQGILQGTFETFEAVARKRFGGSLRGRLVVTSGLGGMGGAQPLAVTMSGGVALCIDVDPARIQRRLDTGYVDEVSDTLDAAVRRCDVAREEGRALSVAVCANAAEALPALLESALAADVVTDQTSAHDPLHGYVPAGLSLTDAASLRASFYIYTDREDIDRLADARHRAGRICKHEFRRRSLLLRPRLLRRRRSGALYWVSAAANALTERALHDHFALGVQGLVHSVHDDRVLSRPHTLNLTRSWMLGHVPRDAKLITEPFFANSWNSPWPRAITSPRLLLGGESAYARYLSNRLVRAYLSHGYCWVVASSNYWGLGLKDPVIGDGARSYYGALARHGDVRFSASPWGDADRPSGPGEDAVPFDYDFSYDFYPLSYRRPGPLVQVYRLHGGRCGGAVPGRVAPKLARAN